MKLAVLTLVRNEGSRWLPSLLTEWQSYADEIIALDDASDDNTADVLSAAGATVHRRDDAERAWGNEHNARAELYRLGVASDADWLLWLDADMGFSTSPRGLIEGAHDAGIDAIAFRLYDLWHKDSRCLWYREDEFWRAHHVPRVWCVRRSACRATASFNERGLHCGHLPQAGLAIRRTLTAPREIALMHYGYVHPRDRRLKYEAYMANNAALSTAEYEHARSIIYDLPRLMPLDIPHDYDISYAR